MHRLLPILCCILLSFPDIYGQDIIDVEQGWSVPVYDFEGLRPLLNKENDTIYVINFWATWCGPCVKELPYFEELWTNTRDQKLEVILISLDFPRHYTSKLVPFLKKHGIRSQVVVLDDPKANTWIDQVDPDWSGAIPATLVYKAKNRQFYETTFDSYESLKDILKPFNTL